MRRTQNRSTTQLRRRLYLMAAPAIAGNSVSRSPVSGLPFPGAHIEILKLLFQTVKRI
jgi:hypothetical protein